mmetsp:Transcript_7692/g.19151  ORF Transcript_7692/g.19151 Transcript_7692/m.19151 type:complete len:87 (-) Transcript_7692:1473-1733(-)
MDWPENTEASQYASYFHISEFSYICNLPIFKATQMPKNEKRPNTTIDPAGGIKYLTLDEKKIPENAGPAALAIDPPTIERPCIVPL